MAFSPLSFHAVVFICSVILVLFFVMLAFWVFFSDDDQYTDDE